MWAILEIEPTDDLRAIKRAYSKKLKQCKPDEKPEEFKQLHNAYKQAQTYAKLNTHKRNSTSNNEEPIATDQKEKPLQELTNEIFLENTQIDESQELKEKIQIDLKSNEEIISDYLEEGEPIYVDEADLNKSLLSNIEEINIGEEMAEDEPSDYEKYIDETLSYLKENSLSYNKDEWEKILEAHFLNEHSYKTDASLWIFNQIINICREETNDSGHIYFHPRINKDLLLHLNSHFRWQDNVIELEERLDLDGTDYVLTLLESFAASQRQQPIAKAQAHKDIIKKEAVKTNKLWGYGGELLLKRFFAFIADISCISLSLVVIFIVGERTANLIPFPSEYKDLLYQEQTMMIISALFYYIYFTGLERSRYQASLGKIFFNLKVVNSTENTEGISFSSSNIRLIATLISIFFIKVTIWTYLIFSREIQLQDRLSKTKVIFDKQSH